MIELLSHYKDPAKFFINHLQKLQRHCLEILNCSLTYSYVADRTSVHTRLVSFLLPIPKTYYLYKVREKYFSKFHVKKGNFYCKK